MHKCAMANSDFWRDLAVQFLGIPGSAGALSASWLYRVGSQEVGDWTVNGTRAVVAQFDALARRAAAKLSHLGDPDLLTAWLEALRTSGDGCFKHDGEGREADGTQIVLGSIYRLCEASANYCKKLESAALQNEYDSHRGSIGILSRPVVASPFTSVATPAAPLIKVPKPESVGQQINRLREECQLTVDELAERMNLDVRSVRRHLAGDTTPYDRHLWAYRRLFYKLLNRDAVISKMP
jgi:hypothetical protein